MEWGEALAGKWGVRRIWGFLQLCARLVLLGWAELGWAGLGGPVSGGGWSGVEWGADDVSGSGGAGPGFGGAGEGAGAGAGGRAGPGMSRAWRTWSHRKSGGPGWAGPNPLSTTRWAWGGLGVGGDVGLEPPNPPAGQVGSSLAGPGQLGGRWRRSLGQGKGGC